MGEYFDAEGNSIEAFTQEEVDQKTEEAKGTAKTEMEAENQEKIIELNKTVETLQEEAKTAAEALAAADDKDQNFAQLRKAKEESDKKLAEAIELSGRIDSVEKTVKEKDIKDEAMRLAGNDKEMADKILFHYNNFAGEPKDEKDREERFKNAAILAGSGSRGGNQLPGNILSSGGGTTPVQESKGKISEGAKDVAKKLGITDEQLKTHKLI